MISTAGQGADSPLGRLRARALAQPQVVRRGAVTHAQGADLRLLEWACSVDDDVDDPRVVKRANPASWITVDQLRAARASLPDLAHRRFVANMWTERAGHWLPPGAWQRCVGEPQLTPGETIWIGVDVGGERSASAVVWLNERLHVGVEVFHGESAVLEVGELVRELAHTYSVAEVTGDPMRAGQLLAELERERLSVTVFPQTDARMIPASQGLHGDRRTADHAPGRPGVRPSRGQHGRPPQPAWLARRQALLEDPHRRRCRVGDGARTRRGRAAETDPVPGDALMPPRSCLGCGRLIAAGSRCRACRLRKGSTRSWRKLRQQVRVRGGHRCYRCGGRATEVDHVIPLAMGGRDHPDNLKACCRRCNRVKGAA